MKPVILGDFGSHHPDDDLILYYQNDGLDALHGRLLQDVMDGGLRHYMHGLRQQYPTPV